ncbi:MAG: hypothetical protein JWM98_2535 [Thermoleophilia bacterium]|nr:hypothetical protein [Thermoleophilia bacterium]
MLRPRHMITFALAVLCAALVAGCGGAMSKGDYQKEVRGIDKRVEKDLDALDSNDPSASDINKAESSIDKAANDLDDLDPPSKVKDAHKDLVDVVRDTSKLMGRVGPLIGNAKKDPSKLSDKDVKELQKVSEDFAGIEKRMTKVQKEFEDAGYTNIGFGSNTAKK